jgi:hypothetical protein
MRILTKTNTNSSFTLFHDIVPRCGCTCLAENNGLALAVNDQLELDNDATQLANSTGLLNEQQQHNVLSIHGSRSDFMNV